MIETLECIGVLISIASAIENLKNKLFNSDRKKEISQWVYDIGDLIEDIAISYDKGYHPHQSCARIEVIYENFSKVVGDAITEKEEKDLKKLLEFSLNIERMTGEYMSLRDYDKTSYIQELYSISGSILGIADTLKYQK